MAGITTAGVRGLGWVLAAGAGAGAGMCGTVALTPSRTSTWCGATSVPAPAVTPNSAAAEDPGRRTGGLRERAVVAGRAVTLAAFCPPGEPRANPMKG